MPKFAFTAVAPDGRMISGIERADSAAVLRTRLTERNLHAVDVREKRSILQLEITKEKLSKKQLMHFSRQLAVFLRAGIPILVGLEVIGEEASNKVLRRVLAEMAGALRAGETFADSAAAHPEAFPRFYVSVLRSAELTGNLGVVLDELAEYIERDIDARQKVFSALFYPAVVFGLSIVVGLVLTIFVLPRFEAFFIELDAELPLPTRMVLAVADFLGDWGWAVGAAIGAAVVGGLLAIRTGLGRSVFDRLVLRLPALGDIVRHAILERICRVLASMVGAGVPLPDAMAVTSEVANNTLYRRGIASARQAMMHGQGLAGPLAATGLFPGSARQMLRVGEDTGTLHQQLTTAAKYFDRELEYKIKRFTSLFEPAVIIFMGVVVGFVALAMVSAMYGIYGQVE
ncbi:MAG: type II secretion system F family protein [Acidimicrobiales bacterium]